MMQESIFESGRCDHDTKNKKRKRGCNDLQPLVFLGSPTWARTRDLRINSPALYQLSYRGTAKRAF